jgi:DNA topoisomerase I
VNRRHLSERRTRGHSPALPPDASRTVKQAGLRYVDGREAGIQRVRRGNGFAFLNASGKRITEPDTLARIAHLAIPPAWTDVWICPHPDGHIQATGRDVRGRKQYRYHENWRAVRDENKFERMIAFGVALPKIRQRVARDLRRRGLGREKVLAAMVRLLETTLIRVGNEEYARQNHSFGLSTMRDRHVSIRRGVIHFEFRGKGGKKHEIDLHDPKLAEVVRRAQDLPGQELFQYVDENGAQQKISSEDVNEYLRSVAGGEFSAKDFRTWAGTVLAAIALCECEQCGGHRQAKKNVTQAIERAAERLGNTPAICRKSYVHPAVIAAYLKGTTIRGSGLRSTKTAVRKAWDLNADETALLAFLRRQQRVPPMMELLKRSLSRRPPKGSARRKR